MKHLLFLSLACLAAACAKMPRLTMTDIPERPAFTDENMDTILSRLMKVEELKLCKEWPASWGNCTGLAKNYCRIYGAIPFEEHRLLVDSLMQAAQSKGYKNLDAIIIYRSVSGFNEYFIRQYYLRSNGKLIAPGLMHTQTSARGFDMKEFTTDSLRIDYPILNKGGIRYFNSQKTGFTGTNMDYIFIQLDSEMNVQACRVAICL